MNYRPYLLLLCGCGQAGLLQAQDAPAPFRIVNEAPLSWLLGLPSAPNARLLQASEQHYQWTLDWASHYRSSENTRERLVIDAETVTASLNWQWGWRQGWQLGADLGFRHQGGGQLDGVIMDWHDLWSLPQGGREYVANDQFLLYYRNQGRVELRQSEAASGIADAKLSVSKALWQFVDDAVSVQFQLKLPLADSSDVLGNEAWAGSALLAWQHRWFNGAQFNAYGGAQYGQDGEILANRRLSLVAVSGISLQYPLLDQLWLGGQLDGHTAPYDSRLVELQEALQATMGVYHTGPKWQWQFAVVEDLRVGGSSDVVFRFALEHRVSKLP